MTTIWEIDFYSRPILDEQKKKVWEVLVCESALDSRSVEGETFRYSQFCSNTQVNSIWLKEALEEAIKQAPNPPDRIRFFRRQMANMITKACADLGVPSAISRRAFNIHRWLKQRHEDFYPNQPGYQAGNNPSVQFEIPIAQPLPDALVGERWAFVTLEASAFQDMGEWQIDFGEGFSLESVGIAPETKIPGLIVFSSRAFPIAAWLSGLELAYLEVEPVPAVSAKAAPTMRLILETGVSDRWIMASFSDAKTQAEAKGFETAKAAANQVHFLALQTSPEVEAFTGFWLLQKLDLA